MKDAIYRLGGRAWLHAWEHTSFNQVDSCWKPLLHRNADGRHRHDIAKTCVSHERSSDHATSVILTTNVRGHDKREPRGPGYAVELLPPSGDHSVNIEPKNERYRNILLEFAAVFNNFFKSPKNIHISVCKQWRTRGGIRPWLLHSVRQ